MIIVNDKPMLKENQRSLPGWVKVLILIVINIIIWYAVLCTITGSTDITKSDPGVRILTFMGFVIECGIAISYHDK